MKTKHLFFSTVLAAAAFSACSNEDLVENGNAVVNGEGVNISVTATKGEQADTRFGIDVKEDGALGSQYWAKTDMLGALLYTNADGNNMLTNYPFKPAEGSKFDENGKAATLDFSTPTAVSKGKYVFYTQYRKDHIGDEEFEVKLAGRQEMDPANPTAHISEYDLMITPAVSLEGIKYGDATELPLTFRSIYNATRFHIELKEADKPVTIQRIVIKNGTTSPTQALLKTKSKIVPSKLNDLVKGITESWSDGRTKDESTVVLESSGELVASEATAEDYKRAANALQVGTGAHVGQIDDETSIVLAIKGGKTLKAGESFDAYVLLPAGTYTDGLAYDIYTDRGVSRKKTGLAASNLVLTAGKAKRINVELKYKVNGNDIELPTTFDIASDQDWLDAVAYVTENYGSYGSSDKWATPTFNLLQDVKGSLPNFKVIVDTGDKKLTLTGTNNLNTIAYDLKKANIGNEGTLTIAGGTASAAAVWTVKTLTNSGTVTIAANSKLAVEENVVNTGNITNAGVVEVTGTTTNGNVITKPAAVITNTNKMTLTGALTNYKKATVNVNQTAASTTFTLGVASENYGAINIADGATLTADAGQLTNKGVITLNNAAALTGGGTGKELDNEEGVIIITDAGKNYGLTVPAANKNGVIKTAVASLDAIKTAGSKVGAVANTLINTIELTQSIKVEDNLSLTTADLSLATGVKLEVNGTKTVTCKNLVIAGAGASVAPYDKEGVDDKPAAALTAGAVVVAENATFTIAENLTVGNNCTALTVGKNATLTNNGDIRAGDSETVVTVNVAEGGKLINETTGTMTYAKLNIATNKGTITNNSKTEIKVAGKMVGSMNGAFAFN